MQKIIGAGNSCRCLCVTACDSGCRLKELEEQYRKEKVEADHLFEQQRKVGIGAFWEAQLVHDGSHN